ncbi:YsnF/AvaK domain-containing protein [Paracoccus yeei]|uniref:YsnF/AvaK domain-containing protein n=1 Tax=Paracoccus yeei TaxID=147645 RepID=UPI0028D02563|nr:YsnF/AvaK domain-containing protein [Paracoccus yeei]
MPDEPDDIIPVIQEQLGVSVERRLAGRVRVSVRTQTDESLVPVDLTQVDVAVERVPVNRAVDTAPEVVTRGDVTIIPVVEERLILTRQLYLREEIHIRRVERREMAEVPVETRKQVATIERLPADEDNPIPPTNPDQFPRKG